MPLGPFFALKPVFDRAFACAGIGHYRFDRPSGSAKRRAQGLSDDSGEITALPILELYQTISERFFQKRAEIFGPFYETTFLFSMLKV